MLLLRFAGQSAPSAQAIADQSDDIELMRDGSGGDVNWGRERADTILNPDISNATNKRVMRELFASHNVPMPKLYNLEEARAAVEAGQTIVGRPDRHSRGRGYWKIATPDELERALKGTRRKRAATHFMAFVEADREYRVHIFKGRSIRISEKQFFLDESGIRDYTTIKPNRTNIKRVRKAAKKAVQALELDFGAVDILATDEQVWCLEVNCAPGLGGSMPSLWAETFKTWKEQTE